MKKILALLLALIMVLSMAACGAKTEAPAQGAPAAADDGAVSADDIPDEMTSADGTYQVAFIADVGQLKD